MAAGRYWWWWSSWPRLCRWLRAAEDRCAVWAEWPRCRPTWCGRWPRRATSGTRRSRWSPRSGRLFVAGRPMLLGLDRLVWARIEGCWTLCRLGYWSRSRPMLVYAARLRGSRSGWLALSEMLTNIINNVRKSNISFLMW